MKNLTNCVVEEIKRDLERQYVHDITNNGEPENAYFTEVVRITFSEYIQMKVVRSVLGNWWATAEISTDEGEGGVIGHNILDVTLETEGKKVINFRKVKEVLRDTIGDKIRY